MLARRGAGDLDDQRDGAMIVAERGCPGDTAVVLRFDIDDELRRVVMRRRGCFGSATGFLSRMGPVGAVSVIFRIAAT